MKMNWTINIGRLNLFIIINTRRMDGNINEIFHLTENKFLIHLGSRPIKNFHSLSKTRKNTKRHKSINRKSVNINVNKSNDNSSSNSNFHLNKTNSILGIRKEKNGIMNYNIIQNT